MNSLNSILIEGALVGDPVAKNKRVTFIVRFHRFFNKDNARHEEIGVVLVEALGPLGRLCSKTLKNGKGVRIVGRIRATDSIQGSEIPYRILVHAETVELKPKLDIKP